MPVPGFYDPTLVSLHIYLKTIGMKLSRGQLLRLLSRPGEDLAGWQALLAQLTINLEADPLQPLFEDNADDFYEELDSQLFA